MEIECRCLVCGESLDDPLRLCPRCDTPHHTACWEYNGGCAVFGCRDRAWPTVRRAAPARTASTPRRRINLARDRSSGQDLAPARTDPPPEQPPRTQGRAVAWTLGVLLAVVGRFLGIAPDGDK